MAIKPGENDVFTLVPQMKTEYDFDKNGDFDIYHEGVSSEKRVWWLCKECGKSWETHIMTRIKKTDNGYEFKKCTHYNTIKRKKDEVPFVIDEPKLMKFWDLQKNTVDPATIHTNDDSIAFWYCNNCNHHWDCGIRSRMRLSEVCPNCRDIPTFKTLNSDILLDVTKQDKEKLQYLTRTSNEEFDFTCHICGYPFHSSVKSRFKKQGTSYVLKPCKICSIKHTVANTPKLMKYWDIKKNKELNPNFLSADNTTIVSWHCTDCNNRWNLSICQQNRRKTILCDGCMQTLRITKGIDDLLTLIPDAAKLYDFEKNEQEGIDVYKLGANSSIKVNWKCPNCEHSWKKKVKNQIKRNNLGKLYITPCQKCNGITTRKLINSDTYKDILPKLKSLYDNTINKIPFDEVTVYQSHRDKFSFKCDICLESFTSVIIPSMAMSIRNGFSGCPYCSHTKVRKGESFGDLHPELIDEYSSNNEQDIFNVFPNCKDEVEWICRNNPEHIWHISFVVRHMGYGTCPKCNNAYVIKGHNTFADVYKDYLYMYSPNNEKQADNILYNSCLWLKWICPDCGEEFGSYINDVFTMDDEEIVAIKETACPYCNDRMVAANVNSLGHLYPELIQYYSSNNERNAFEVSPFAKALSKWICPDCGGEFNESNDNFVKDEYDCPYCNNRLVLPNYNSFNITQQEIHKEWNVVVNNLLGISANHIGEKNNSLVWWDCPKGHKYTMSPSNRVYFRKRSKETCPYCKGLRRKKRHFI